MSEGSLRQPEGGESRFVEPIDGMAEGVVAVHPDPGVAALIELDQLGCGSVGTERGRADRVVAFSGPDQDGPGT